MKIQVINAEPIMLVLVSANNVNYFDYVASRIQSEAPRYRSVASRSQIFEKVQ